MAGIRVKEIEPTEAAQGDVDIRKESMSRQNHMAVLMDDYIVVLGGTKLDFSPIEFDDIRLFNLVYKTWHKCVCDNDDGGGLLPPTRICSSAVVIKGISFMFGGRSNDGEDIFYNDDQDIFNDLWMLMFKDKFTHCKWSERRHNGYIPSDRAGHSAWEYADLMWVFGGTVVDDDGDDQLSNNVVAYDPQQCQWKEVTCSGALPPLREEHRSTLIKDKVYLFAVCDDSEDYEDYDYSQVELHELNMNGMEWTKITASGMPRPRGMLEFSFTAISDDKIILCRGQPCNSQSDLRRSRALWILHVADQRWQFFSAESGYHTCNQVTVRGKNNDLIIMGGILEDGHDVSCAPMLQMETKPPGLTALSLKTIFDHNIKVPKWDIPEHLRQRLPKKHHCPQH